MNQQRIIMSNLLILMIVAMAFMRAYEWVVRSSAKLEQLSDIYATMSHVIDINSAGWLLLIASVTLGASIFVGGRGGQALLLIGGLGVGSIMIMYSMIPQLMLYYLLHLIQLEQLVLHPYLSQQWEG